MTARGLDTLKGRNLKYLITFVGANVVAFSGLLTGFHEDWALWSKASLSSTAASVAVGALAIVLNGVVSGDVKAALVSWRIRHPLPGCRAFSRYMHADPRIDPEILRARYGPLPESPEQQNRLWYRIYKAHEEEPSVIDAHKSYLLARDLTALSAVFLVTLGPAALVLLSKADFAAYYIVVLAVVFLLTSQAGRNYGKGLVTNVMAVESAR